MSRKARTLHPQPTAIIVPGAEAASSEAIAKTPALPADFIPPLIAGQGTKATKRFLTFFTDTIRNKHTREAYHRATCRFWLWCEAQELTFACVESFHVATYIEELGGQLSKPSVKQHLAAIRSLFDWLVVGQVCPLNPAAAVRGPRHSVVKGKTPILNEEDAKRLLDSIDAETVIGARDRALIAAMIYTFGRVSAVTGMRVGDYFAAPDGERYRVRLHEKNGRDALHDERGRCRPTTS